MRSHSRHQWVSSCWGANWGSDLFDKQSAFPSTVSKHCSQGWGKAGQDKIACSHQRTVMRCEMLNQGELFKEGGWGAFDSIKSSPLCLPGTEASSPCKLERGDQVPEKQGNCSIVAHSLQAGLQRLLNSILDTYREKGGEDLGWERPAGGHFSDLRDRNTSQISRS